MSRTGSLLLILALALPPSLQAQGGPGAREELRDALREHFVHVLEERLELEPERARALRPPVEVLVAAQHDALLQSKLARRKLQRALRAEGPEPSQVSRLLAEALEADARGGREIDAARSAWLQQLSPREAVTYLLFERDYRREVALRLRQVRGQRGQGGEANRREGRRREPLKGRQAARELEPEDRERIEEDLTLLLSLRVRRELGLDTEQLLTLLPRLEENVAAGLELAELERTLTSQLSRALEESQDDEELAELVTAVETRRQDVNDRLRSAREGLIAGRDPVEAARLLDLQESFRREAPRRWRQLQRGLSGNGREEGWRRGRRRD